MLKGPFILKVAALVFAIISYFYIHGELHNAQTKNADPSYKLIKLTAKHLPVKLRVATSPPDGYRILEKNVSKRPDEVVVIGPEALLEGALSAETAIIDISESTKTAVRRIPLESVAGIHVTGDPYFIDVTIPIEKIEATQ